jgi:hypothetical protein
VDPKLRQVVRHPLTVLWDEDGNDLNVHPVRRLGAEDIRAILRSGRPVPFVTTVHRLKWIRGDERFDFWKNELQPQLAEPGWAGNESDWPHGYWWWATEWRSEGEDVPYCIVCDQGD